MRDKPRDFYTDLFIRVANICEPEHSSRDIDYPIDEGDIHETWKRSDSNSWAHVGIYHEKATKIIKYAVDIDYFNRKSIERVLAVTVHEVTHIEEGSHTPGSAHHPRFWERMVQNGIEVLKNMDQIKPFFEVDVTDFIGELTDDPNSHMVDQRMETAKERKDKMWQELKQFDPEINANSRMI